jgi:hypothetical protein
MPIHLRIISTDDPQVYLGVHYPERGEADLATGRATGNLSTQSNHATGQHVPSARREMPKRCRTPHQQAAVKPHILRIRVLQPRAPDFFFQIPRTDWPGKAGWWRYVQRDRHVGTLACQIYLRDQSYILASLSIDHGLQFLTLSETQILENA